jgi:hypothetical protein
VHTVVRDLTNDYGEDVLKAHYEKEHQHWLINYKPYYIRSIIAH